jgi:hypothetical protein
MVWDTMAVVEICAARHCMKFRQRFGAVRSTALCWDGWQSRAFFLVVCALSVLPVTCSGCAQSSGKPIPDATATADLPEISTFLSKPSDRFLVDIEDVSRGHPFLGVNSPHPHAGGHVHFDNSGKRWPKGEDEPANYPAIYAVADGIVGRVDTRFGLPGGNDRYGIDLVIAKDKSGAKCRFCYSIEPMCPEPSDGFYKRFLFVKEGQTVRKGDVIAYLYTPFSSRDACHIHFHMMIDGRKGFLAPAIFTPEIARAFHEQCQGFKDSNGGKAIPPSMGYRIGAEENPFGTGGKDEL